MFLALLGIGIGLSLAIQTAVNSRLRTFVVSPYIASMVSFIVAAIFLVLMMFIFESSFGFSTQIFVTEPIWIWFGGLCGVIGLTANIILFPKIGSVQTAVLPIVGQIIMGMLIDHFGWFHSLQNDFNLQRLIGILLVLAGVFLAVVYQGIIMNRGFKTAKQEQRLSPLSLWIWRITGIGTGMLMAIQFAINGHLGQVLNSSIQAALVSFTIGAVTLIVVVLLINRTFVTLKNPVIQKAPWWVWIGGILGGTYVLINVFLVGQIGTGRTVLLALFGQISGSILIERFGWFQSIKNKISWAQIVGLLIMFIGIFIIQML